MMDRREALRMTSGLLGATIIGGQFFLSGCRREKASGVLIPEEDVALLDEIGEAILPATDRSPGAKAAAIGSFMQSIVADCYSEEEQQTFIAGIASVKQKARADFGGDFMDMSGADRLKMLAALDSEASGAGDTGSTHYFGMIKQLTIWGYFTSQPGATKALRYNPIPGEFIGCIPYKEGDKAWAL